MHAYTGRDELITTVIQEVEEEFKFSSEQKRQFSVTQQKLRAFKRSAPEALAEGLASLKFERMVKLAEKKIIRQQRQAVAQTSESMAESLATELFHTPGRMLTAQEIVRVYDAAGCTNQTAPPNDCDSAQKMNYRTADGTCNNLNDPTLGAVFTEIARYIPPRYDDGVSRPRGFLQSQNSPIYGGPFASPNPSPRVVSTKIMVDVDNEDLVHTHMVMQFGQFASHDIVDLSQYLYCPETCVVTDETEGSCFPFVVPIENKNIMVTMALSSNCAEFFRSLGACPRQDLLTNEIPPRQQLNEVTHFLDGSIVYGYTDDILNNQIRNMTAGAPKGSLNEGAPAQGN
jgi:hypothetical protein